MASRSDISQLRLQRSLVEAAQRITIGLSGGQLRTSLESANSLLVQVGQRPPDSICEALVPLMNSMVLDELLHHADLDVQVTLASCLVEVARISAPDPSYSDDIMREVFRLLMVSFRQLSCESGRNYLKALDVLETVEQVKFPLMLLDIGPAEQIPEMFQIFLDNIRSAHPPEVFKHMETIMTTIIKLSSSVSLEMLTPLLHSVRMENKIASPSSWALGLKVFENCAAQVAQSLRQLMELRSLEFNNYAEIVSLICQNKLNKVPDKSNAPSDLVLDETLINTRIKVYWPADKRFYTGTVVEFDPAVKKHKILYDDSEVEILNLDEEVWESVNDKRERDQTSPVDKAVRTTEEERVKKKKTPLKNQHATSSSSKRAKAEGEIMGKSRKSSAS